MIRLLFVTDSFPAVLAGTERQMYEMLRRFDRTRVTPFLLCIREGGRPPGVEEPCPSFVVPVPSLRSLRTVQGYPAFTRLHRDLHFDVVQTFMRDANLLGTAWARCAGVRVVVSSRRNIGYWHTPVERAFLRALGLLTTHYVANSAAAADVCHRVEGVPRTRISLIPNGIDVEAFLAPSGGDLAAIRRSWGFTPTDVVVGAVGNLRDVKNHEFFVRAAADVARRHQSARFVILGEGTSRGPLEAEIARLGLKGRFVLPGQSAAVARELHAMDVCVLCSRSESMPNAVLEYMAASRPTVAVRVGGVPEVLTHGVTGFMYQPGDLLTFIREVEGLVVDPGARERIGAAARADVVRRFDWSAVVGQYVDLYERLLARRCRKRP